ncbi:MAG: hypothetical protein IH852_11645 [Bacteroidetes bacterium]|nr:hypothetical protein [Bacteroidota bacterium]
MDFSIIEKIIADSKHYSKPFSKQKIVNNISTKYNLKKDRKLYLSKILALRFSSAKSGYSNTFLGFQKILDNDSKPLIACIIRDNELEFLMANSTFINCISHSSKLLTFLNIRGSANLSNIIREFSGLKNELLNFNELFKMHSDIPQNDNIDRIVENTKRIKAKGEKYNPSAIQLKTIYNSAQFINGIETDEGFQKLKSNLFKKVRDLKDEILETSKIDNVNLRGNKIEQLITKGVNSHDLGDILGVINDDNKIIIDVKSKLLNSSSAPKAYNVDKLLEAISIEKTYFGYLFIGVDDLNKQVKVNLVSFIDKFLIDNTNIQHHWSGKNSRGTAQLTDNIKGIFFDSFQNEIDLTKAKEFIKTLIRL